MQKLKTVRAIEPNAGARMSLRNKLIKLNKDFGKFCFIFYDAGA